MVKFFDITALIFYCALIYWLSDQPSLPLPMIFTFQDKFEHFSAYFIMGILAWRSFRHIVKPALILAIVSLVFCSLHGIADEWHQSFVEGRSPDVLDWVADTLGASVAMLALIRFYNRPRLV